MKKAIAFLVIAMAVAFVASVGMASATLPVTKTLWAGQDIDAGSVTVSDDGTNIIITYDTKDGWELTAYHVYVDTVRPTKSAPGKFPYKGDVDPAVTTITVQTTVPATGTLFIAAQAELQKDTGEIDTDGNPIYLEESAWADGTQIRENKNWATYFEVTI